MTIPPDHTGVPRWTDAQMAHISDAHQMLVAPLLGEAARLCGLVDSLAAKIVCIQTERDWLLAHPWRAAFSVTWRRLVGRKP